ncbi:PREDICTED: uncharacterized protein LOC109318155 [Crocodylus porosus]|uniref:uncharacterized protein LOC109318155 n=1 Tax=Crocodylus porosus TaxID=8502 RepID=UPI00093C13C6|nr:PREDICTED: uncharacterized protein LOC109318155 [Crocodylus porosus]
MRKMSIMLQFGTSVCHLFQVFSNTEIFLILKTSITLDRGTLTCGSEAYFFTSFLRGLVVLFIDSHPLTARLAIMEKMECMLTTWIEHQNQEHVLFSTQAAIEEGSYDPRQVFNLDETRLFWKWILSRTFISVKEKTSPRFMAKKDRSTLLLGANAAGDFKLKPFVVYHTENPQAHKVYAKGHLPVYWRANQEGVTGSLFEG